MDNTVAAARDNVLQAALFALCVILITVTDRLQQWLGYTAPTPLDTVLRWLPGLTLVLLAAEVVVQTGIRVVFDAIDRIRERATQDESTTPYERTGDPS